MDLNLYLDMDISVKARESIPPFSLSDVPNKSIWYDASDPSGYTINDDEGTSRVSPIIDLSGNSRNATKSVLAEQCITGTRQFKENNTFDYIAAQASRYDIPSSLRTLMGTENYSFFVVVKPDITTNQRILVGSNGASPDWAISFQENQASFRVGSKSVVSSTVTGIIDTNNMNVLGVRRTGNTLDLWVNGVQYTNNTETVISLSLSHGPYLFHELNNINEFDGQFGELFGTSDAPSDTLVGKILETLAAKWRV